MGCAETRSMRSLGQALLLCSLVIFEFGCSDSSPSPSLSPDGSSADGTDVIVPSADAAMATAPVEAGCTTDATCPVDSGAEAVYDGGPVHGTFGAACTESATCDGGECLFAIDAGCSAAGACFYHVLPPGSAECQHTTGMCGCDGTGAYQLDCEAPGYATAAVPSPTAYICAIDAGADGAIGEAGADAAIDGASEP
jgi:hypothetical protein